MPVESLFGRLMMWTMICGVSAAPSFFVAVDQFSRWDQIVAMVLGVVMFIAAYTWVTGTPLARRLNENPLVRRTAYIGYGTRIVVSIIFPIGMTLDFFCGIFTAFIIDAVFDGLTDSFAAILAWTLVQGAVLNVILFAYMLPVYGVQRLFHKPLPKGCCVKCGYDLRASAERCPECGEPIANGAIESRA